MQVDKDKVISLLGSGLSATVVANSVGCEVSYISQLMADQDFATQVAELRTKDLVKHKSLDDRYDDMESKLIDKLADLIPLITRPRDVLNALSSINSAKRKAGNSATAALDAGTVVRLALPQTVINNYTVNINGNMVKVGERNLTPMPSSILMKTLEDQMRGKINDVPILEEKETEQPRELLRENFASERIVGAHAV